MSVTAITAREGTRITMQTNRVPDCHYIHTLMCYTIHKMMINNLEPSNTYVGMFWQLEIMKVMC